MQSQDWYLERMRAAGYKIDMKGECYGMSHMAIFAFLADDIETFNQRLQQINTMPKAWFEDDFAELRRQKQHYLQQGQTAQADEITGKINDLKAFFDGVALNQRPSIYFHDQQMQPLSKKQDIRKTMPITMPVRLDNETHKPFIIAQYVNLYNKKYLGDYFDLLKNHLGAHSFTLNTIAPHHAITLAYNATTKAWLLIDPNHLPGQTYLHSADLAVALCKSFEETNFMNAGCNLKMGTEIITTSQYSKEISIEFEKLRTTSQWQRLLNYNQDVELYDHLIYNNSDNTPMKDENILKEALHFQHKEVISQLLQKSGLELFKNLDLEMLIPSLKLMPLEKQHNLLVLISFEKKIIIFNQWHDVFAVQLFQTLPEEERLALFLRLQTATQVNYLQMLAYTNQHDDRNFLFLHLDLQQKVDLIASSGKTLDLFSLVSENERAYLFKKLPNQVKAACLNMTGNSDSVITSLDLNPLLAPCVTDEERTAVFIDLAPEYQVHYLCTLSISAMTAYRDRLYNQLTTPQKTNLFLTQLIVFTQKKSQECITLVPMLTDNDKLLILRRLGLINQARFLSILSSQTTTIQLDTLLESLSVKEKEKIFAWAPNMFDMNINGEKCLRALLRQLPESSRINVVMMKDSDGQTIMHRAANSPQCLKLILDSLPMPQRLEAVMIRDQKKKSALDLATDPTTFEMILTIFPDIERLNALIEYNPETGYPPNFIKQKNLLSVVVKHFPDAGSIESDAIKLKLVKRFVSWILQITSEDDESLSAILHCLPEKELIEVIKERTDTKHSILYKIINNNPPILSAFLHRLSTTARFVLLNEKNGSELTPLFMAVSNEDNPASVQVIMQAYAPKDRYEALFLGIPNELCGISPGLYASHLERTNDD